MIVSATLKFLFKLRFTINIVIEHRLSLSPLPENWWSIRLSINLNVSYSQWFYVFKYIEKSRLNYFFARKKKTLIHVNLNFFLFEKQNFFTFVTVRLQKEFFSVSTTSWSLGLIDDRPIYLASFQSFWQLSDLSGPSDLSGDNRFAFQGGISQQV